MTFSSQNREAALRHLEEAEQFLSRIEEKKDIEIKKWRQKLKRSEEREKLLNYYRMKRQQELRKPGRKFRRRNSQSRKSVWDVDNVLLKELMNEFTEEERRELEELSFSQVSPCMYFLMSVLHGDEMP